MLEELALDYRVHPIDIGNDEQFAPDYVAINPNAKIPTIVDQDGPGGGAFAVFESGAILIYLADKAGRLLSPEPRRRSQAIQWLMFQVGGVGPMLGQAQHFRRFAPQPGAVCDRALFDRGGAALRRARPAARRGRVPGR